MTEPISHPAMVAALAKPGQDIINELTPAHAHLLHMAIGISGEAGELLESIELSFNAQKPFDYNNFIEEGGDLEFFIEGTYQGLHLERFPIDQRKDVATSVEYAAVRIAIAASNVLDLVKKLTIYNKPVPREDFISPLHAVERAMADFRYHAKITRAEMIDGNIAKLGKRYSAGKYSNEQAQARADKVEPA